MAMVVAAGSTALGETRDCWVQALTGLSMGCARGPVARSAACGGVDGTGCKGVSASAERLFVLRHPGATRLAATNVPESESGRQHAGCLPLSTAGREVNSRRG